MLEEGEGGSRMSSIMKIHLGEPDCGEGGPERPARGICDPPEGTCRPMKKPGYPPKPRVTREPFCFKCPPKRPCNLNKCPTETEGTCRRAIGQEIAFILNSQSQRSCRLRGIHIRNYGRIRGSGVMPTRLQSGKSGCNLPSSLDKSGESRRKEPSGVEIVYQKCPPVPRLPKMPECVAPRPTVIIKCPPLPQCPKCPSGIEEPGEKCKDPGPVKGASSERGIWDKLTGFIMRKRKMSTSSDSDNWRARKCKTVTEICSDKENEKKLNGQDDCPKERRTSCYPERIKCPELKKAEAPIVELKFVDEKIDYSKEACPRSKLEPVGVCPRSVESAPARGSEAGDGGEKRSLLVSLEELPRAPSQPVSLCPCPPPPKLHPGACPCAPEMVIAKEAAPIGPCPAKPKHPCPRKRIASCLKSNSPR